MPPPAPIAQKIVIATHNKGKWQEFVELLSPYALDVVSSGQLGLPSPEETGVTFTENALLKARAACAATGMLALADDSGLCVNALDGQPGIYSARWAEPTKDFNVAMQRIQNELGDAMDRSAYFICVLALVWPDGRAETVEGRVEGILALAPRGTRGHGYDPIFIPNGETRVFAEMGDDEKNVLSHRGKATRTLVARFFA
jgi:XTP/dITP diphosphohydrolase